MSTLIFPSTMQASWLYGQDAITRGEEIIAAASIEQNNSINQFKKSIQLPFINDKNFIAEFKNILSVYSIKKIFCPHVVVHKVLSELIVKEKLSVFLVNPSPVEQQTNYYKTLLEKADSILADPLIKNQNTLSRYHVAAFLRESSLMYGESSEEKIIQMFRIFSNAPSGDIIEIGSAWGRSAYILLCLANHYKLGNVLAVDPWQANAAVQAETNDTLKAVTHSWDWEIMHQAFITNVISIANNNFNYLRATSDAAFSYYKNNNSVTTYEFSQILYTKKISILHIDGNHDYAAVKNDFSNWVGFLEDQGWVILDDYIWHHGDGPFKLGNEILISHSNIIEHFVAGNALFIKFSK